MKKILAVAFLSVVLVVAGQTFANDTAVLQTKFEFNEAAGTTVTDAAGTHTGEFQNFVEWAAEGIDGSALLFPDTGFVQTDYPGIMGAGQVSVSAWVKTDSSDITILVWGTEDRTTKFELKVHAGGQLRAQIFGDGIFGTTPINDGLWHHVVAVMDSNAVKDLGYVQLFVDGKLDNVPGPSKGVAINVLPDFNMQVGGLAVKKRWYRGYIDQVAVYSGVLTPEEVLAIFAEESPRLVQPMALQTRFEFNEGAGTTVTDTRGIFTGELMRNTQWVEDGIDGNCLFFMDSAYVQTTCPGIIGTGEVSVSAWIRTDSTNKTILAWGKEDLLSKMELKINNDGTFRAQIFGNRVFGTTNVADGQWHHVVAVVDAEGTEDLNQSKLYVDGVLDNVPAPNNGNSHNVVFDLPLQVGGYTPIDMWYQGKIDQIAVYAGSLSAEEVKAMYDEEITRLVVSSVEHAGVSAPTQFVLEQNYPNPFNPVTQISYSLPVAGEVTLAVFNAHGQQVATLVDGHQGAGDYQLSFDAGQLSSGLYFYRLQTSDGVLHTRKMMLLK